MSFHYSWVPTLFIAIFVAGSGKSVLWYVISCYCFPRSLTLFSSSGIIEDIKAQHEAGSTIIAYFYCDFRNEDKQNCRNLVLSIISQLCDQSDLCCDTLSRVYLAHNKGAQKPSDKTLANCLTEMVSLPVQDPIYLIMDALDECPNNSGVPSSRAQVFDLVQELVDLRLPSLHICVTSRPEVDIHDAIGSLASHSVSLHEESGQKKDITDYVRSVVHSNSVRAQRRWRDVDKDLVINTLSERADGM